MKAAVLEEIGKPLRIMDLPIPSTQDIDFESMILVKMLTVGICGAQLQEIDGTKGNPAHCPHLLGHEGCGVVWGTNQKVVVHWRKGEGKDAVMPVLGTVKYGPCTTFSEYTLVARNRITQIPNDVPSDLACLLGCCLSTALATVENVARVQAGQNVLVIGCGGVGLSMILAARYALGKVTAIDGFDSKRPFAESLGATFHRSNELYAFRVEGYDAILDTTGNAEIFETFVNYIAPSGKYVLVGQPRKGEPFRIPNASRLFDGEGQTIQATQAGGFNPTIDIPYYLRLWRNGFLTDYPKLITHRIKLDEINEGISLMRSGRAGRVLIEMNHDC